MRESMKHAYGLIWERGSFLELTLLRLGLRLLLDC
jgi:hypothetical protein